MATQNRVSILDVDGLRTACKHIIALCNALDPVNGTYDDEDANEIRYELVSHNHAYTLYFSKINKHLMREVNK